MFGQPTDWKSAKANISNPTLFVTKLKNFDKDNSAHLLPMLKTYTENPDFSRDTVMNKSRAAADLSTWVFAMYNYILAVENCKKLGFVPPKSATPIVYSMTSSPKKSWDNSVFSPTSASKKVPFPGQTASRKPPAPASRSSPKRMTAA